MSCAHAGTAIKENTDTDKMDSEWLKRQFLWRIPSKRKLQSEVNISGSVHWMISIKHFLSPPTSHTFLWNSEELPKHLYKYDTSVNYKNIAKSIWASDSLRADWSSKLVLRISQLFYNWTRWVNFHYSVSNLSEQLYFVGISNVIVQTT